MYIKSGTKIVPIYGEGIIIMDVIALMIDAKRDELHRIAVECGYDFGHPKVIQTSVELDKLLNSFQINKEEEPWAKNRVAI